VNQNICGAYAHAVRSAFSSSSATLGLYYVREIEWSDQCSVSKSAVFDYRKLPGLLMVVCLIGVVWFLLLSCAFFVDFFEVARETTREDAQENIGGTYILFILCPTFAALVVALVNMSKVSVLLRSYSFGF